MFEARGPKSGMASSSLWFSFLYRQNQKRFVICGNEWVDGDLFILEKGCKSLQFSQTMCSGKHSAIYHLQSVMAQVPAEGRNKQEFTWHNGTKMKTNRSDQRHVN